MFNEKSEVWIKLLKTVVIVTFCVMSLGAIICGISDACALDFIDADFISDDGFGDFIIWIIILGIPAFLNLSLGMLMVNFFTNVQDIRQKFCEKK